MRPGIAYGRPLQDRGDAGVGIGDGMLNRRVELEAGRLDVAYRADLADDPAIFGLGERVNPRRAYLFVSRVLGRHVPARPAAMRAAFERLAGDVPADLPGPVVMTGMAETAVGLGAGVHDAYLARTGRRDVLYLATTRAALGGSRLAGFAEVHSHASSHLVYRPRDAGDRVRFATAGSLVMVDDEASSGATFAALSAALSASGMGPVECVRTAVLTDWTGAPDGSALVRGRFVWTPREGAPVRHLPDADVLREGMAPIGRVDDARLGRSVRSATRIPERIQRSLDGVDAPILVLGAGEHVWEPFLVAEALEAEGRDVRFGSTTRSPILAGHAIRHGLQFRDHEGLGIASYLYNVDPSAFSRIILCVDTAARAVDPRLLSALGCDLLVGDVLHDRHAVRALAGDAPPARAIPGPRNGAERDDG